MGWRDLRKITPIQKAGGPYTIDDCAIKSSVRLSHSGMFDHGLDTFLSVLHPGLVSGWQLSGIVKDPSGAFITARSVDAGQYG